MNATPDLLAKLDAGQDIVDTAPGPYYITCLSDCRTRFALVSGPYATHSEALELVHKARRIAEDHDSRAVWSSFGTVRMTTETAAQGVLQRWGYSLDLEQLQEA